MKKRNIRTNPWRLAIQLSVTAIIIYLLIRILTDKTFFADFEAYCPLGGILAFSSFLVNNSLACSMTSVQIVMGAALIIGILFFSKLFCSFICPLGTISEWIGKAGEKLKVRITLSGYADLLLRGLKYAILFITFYYTVASSELFCRKFDPYYAAVTGFGGDVSPSLAIIAIILLVAGSFFIRLFWCKYICPLGAISNVFRFFITFVLVTGGYVIIRLSGIEMSFVWPLAVTCIIAYLLEFYNLRSTVFPVFTIRRHEDICTNCRLCNKYCPQAIEVESMKTVRHIDCHLCGDCIQVCPEKGALTIDRKGKKWLPALVTVLLIASGIIIGKTFELPTLSIYWGDKDKKESMAKYTRHGLKNVKCYGSSMAFASQVRNVPGISGVTTYVRTNTVEILFSPELTDTLKIQEAIFSPVRISLRTPGPDVKHLKSYNLSVENFFDPLDAQYMRNLLMNYSDIYGFFTSFDCPVKIRIFTDAGSDLDIEKLKGIIESRHLDMILADSSVVRIPLGFTVRTITADSLLINSQDYSTLIIREK